MGQCKGRKKRGRATKSCLLVTTKPLESPALSSCDWLHGAYMRLALSTASHRFYRGSWPYLSLLNNGLTMDFRGEVDCGLQLCSHQVSMDYFKLVVTQ